MGYQLSEIKGKNIEMFIPHDELEEFRKIWKNVVEGNSRQIEVERRTKSGDLIWLVNQYTPVQDEKGTISKVLYLAHDVTIYKKSVTDALSNTQQIRSKEKELTESISKLKLAEEKNLILIKETQEHSNILAKKDTEMQDVIRDLLLQKEIVEAQKTKNIETKNTLLDNEEEKLYNRWLNNIRKQLK